MAIVKEMAVSRWSQIAIACFAALPLGGCVSWPDREYRPAIPEYAKLPFVDQVWSTTGEMERQQRHRWPRALTLNDYKDTLRQILRDVMASLDAKNSQSWDFSMTTLVGTTAGAVGALAGKIGLTNTGVGVAGGAQLLQNHYRPEIVRDMHLQAHRKLSCISSEIATLSEYQRAWAIASNQSPGSQEASDALTDISHYVDAVLAEYRQSLLGMPTPTSSPDDLIRFVEDYKAKTQLAARSAASAPSGPGIPIGDPTPPAGVASAPKQAGSSPVPAAVEDKSTTGGSSTLGDHTGLTTTGLPMPSNTMDRGEYQRHVSAGPRYAARFIQLKVRLEACQKLVASR